MRELVGPLWVGVLFCSRGSVVRGEKRVARTRGLVGGAGESRRIGITRLSFHSFFGNLELSWSIESVYNTAGMVVDGQKMRQLERSPRQQKIAGILEHEIEQLNNFHLRDFCCAIILVHIF